MRIRLVLGADLDNNYIPERTLELIKSELEKDSNIALTDENPDVIHVVGAWTPASIGIAKDALAKYIAIIHTPLGTLSPWQKPRSAQVKLTSKCTTIVASGQMENELLDDGNRKNIRNILNPVVTTTTDRATMIAEYKDVYRKAIKTTDDNLWNDVEHKVSLLKEDDSVILNVCKNLLYAQYLYQRKNIPQIFLNGLSELLTKSDFNEDRLGEVLKLIRLFTFTQRIEYVMQESAKLTEGFMPVPFKDDKTSRAMLGMITDYKI